MRPVVIFVLCLLASAAWAQETVPSEKVIVTAPRLTPEVIKGLHDYVGTYTAPAVLSGQLTRWERPICPRTDGLSRDELTAYVSQRIRAVAVLAGAPVAPTPCKPNIEVFFTDDPQGMLNAVKARQGELLGYRGVTTVTHPIQAWYVTATTGLDGKMNIDREVFSDFHFGVMDHQSGGGWMEWGVPTPQVGGYRLKTDLVSEFFNIVIIADKTRTANFQLGPIADDIAMMALSRVAGFETCQAMPSVTSLMAPDCGHKTDGLTDIDLGYLRGVYKMSPTEPLGVQQSAIEAEMKKSLGGQ